MIDPTGMAADTISRGVVGPMVDVFRNAPKREPVQGFWGVAEQIWTGGIHDGYKYDWQGKVIGPAPIMGTPPDIGVMAAAGSIKALVKSIKSLKLLGTTRMRLLRNVKHPQLKKMIDELYPETSVYGDGSTGAMIIEEIVNGTKTSASVTHAIKAEYNLNRLRKFLNGNYGEMVESDRKIIFEIIENLTTGIGVKW